jgi:hypothetical protein
MSEKFLLRRTGDRSTTRTSNVTRVRGWRRVATSHEVTPIRGARQCYDPRFAWHVYES